MSNVKNKGWPKIQIVLFGRSASAVLCAIENNNNRNQANVQWKIGQSKIFQRSITKAVAPTVQSYQFWMRKKTTMKVKIIITQYDI